MPLIWLRVAAVLYGLGLLDMLLQLRPRSTRLSRLAEPLVGLGLIFHFVAFVETVYFSGYQNLLTIKHAESGLALLIAAAFMFMFVRFRTTSPGIFVFPLVFLLTFASAIAERPVRSQRVSGAAQRLDHVSRLHAAAPAMPGLFLSFVASLLYLVQSAQPEAKQPTAWLSRLPALQAIDDLGYKALLFGFPFMTVGLIAGSVLAQEKYGSTFFADPKVLLSLLMWGVYMLLLYTRWSSGWRGRRAAYLATFAFVVAVCAWAANYLSRVHRFIAP